MKLLTVDEIILLHRAMTARTGGSAGLRDRGLLESAVLSPLAAFCGQEIYPTLPEKAARLMFALVSNHAFVDGNKRIGVLAMLVTMRLGGVPLTYTQQELISLGLSAADGTMTCEGILSWIQAHTVQ